MIPCQRHLFDIPEEVAYFNCAYFSPLLRSVGDSGHRGVDRKRHPWKLGAEDFFKESEHARELFAKLVDAENDDIAIIPSVSYGISLSAANIKVKEGDEIVLLDEQFPSNYYPWYELSKVTGTHIVTVQRAPNFDWTSPLLEAITERTTIVAVANVHWTDGTLVDLIKVSEATHRVGAVLVLDVMQSLGAMPFSIKRVQPDFLVAACYKWLFGPYSMGFMYVHPKFQGGRPIENNWIIRDKSEVFAGLVKYTDEFQKGARRFDVGERSNFALMPMVVAALQQIHAWQVPRIQETLSEMTQKIAEQAAELGLEVAPPEARARHLLGVRFPNGLPDGIIEKLAQRQVYVSVRGNAIRIAPHLYNNDRDIEKLMEVLRMCL